MLKSISVTCVLLTAAANTAAAGTVALFSDVNMYTETYGSAGNNQILSNLLGDGKSLYYSNKFSTSFNQEYVVEHFDSLASVSTTTSTVDLDYSIISNFDLLFLDIGFSRPSPYSDLEVENILDFVDAGGSIGIISEVTDEVRLSEVNGFLASIGLSMQLTLPRQGNFISTVLSSPLTEDVTSVTYAAFNPITGGSAAVLGGSSGASGVLVAYETFEASPPICNDRKTPPIGDGIPPECTPPGIVPISATLPLLVGGFALMGCVARRRTA